MTDTEVDKLFERILNSMSMAVGALLCRVFNASYATIGVWVVVWLAMDVCWALIRSQS